MTRIWFARICFSLSSAWAQTVLAPDSPTAPSPSVEISATPPTESPVREQADKQRAVTWVHLRPHFSTTIRMREAVRSVVVGDPSLFWADHQEGDPSLVIVHVRTEQPAQTNLEITTVNGQQALLCLISEPHSNTPVDLALHFDRSPAVPPSIWRNESTVPSVLVAETVPLPAQEPKLDPSVGTGTAGTPVSFEENAPMLSRTGANSIFNRLLTEQQRVPLPPLYGEHPGSLPKERHLQAGVSKVLDEGGTVTLSFSVVNTAPHAIALLPPQVQLSGQVKKRWTTAEQLPVLQFRLDRERLEPGGRANEVLVFERPRFKQAKQSLLLQIAESGAVDQPALAPIGFGVSSEKGGTAYAGVSRQ